MLSYAGLDHPPYEPSQQSKNLTSSVLMVIAANDPDASPLRAFYALQSLELHHPYAALVQKQPNPLHKLTFTRYHSIDEQQSEDLFDCLKKIGFIRSQDDVDDNPSSPYVLNYLTRNPIVDLSWKNCTTELSMSDKDALIAERLAIDWAGGVFFDDYTVGSIIGYLNNNVPKTSSVALVAVIGIIIAILCISLVLLSIFRFLCRRAEVVRV
eukprot:TRINITY_DN1746_c0_g1_i5.p1 TRINITY_DN1746_c0_g1~~TRINITY_DN1746_c0_g1_i5.p1  ORF type:complete len:211 (+),score=24.71 TRINITY_DN1746_c0_g1_i5:104-736(+)